MRKMAGIAVVAALLLAVAGWFYGPRMYRHALINAWIHFNEYDTRAEGSLRVGDPAPDLELLNVDGEKTARLSDFWKDRPLVLIFGSYT